LHGFQYGGAYTQWVSFFFSRHTAVRCRSCRY
jgi:hypothetical protein